MKKPIRVLIIDDSAFMRNMIKDMLESDSRITVIGSARNGEDGLKLINKLTPDVVTLDIEMPIMDGMVTLERIMNIEPLPVIMLASVTKSGREKAMQAMSLGAIDFIAKPSGEISLDIQIVKDEMINKVIAASSAVMKKSGAKDGHLLKESVMNLMHQQTIVAIGTSTGGPRALQYILSAIPKDFPAPIFIVQHMPPRFTKSLADRLNAVAQIRVVEAKDKEKVEPKTAYIAPGDHHLLVHQEGSELILSLTQSPLINGHRPSVNVLFNSIAQLNNYNKIAVVLTGMGKDGAEGVREIKKKDDQAFIIAEAKESAIIYGMPQAALSTGCVNQSIHLHKIVDKLIHIVAKRRV